MELFWLKTIDWTMEGFGALEHVLPLEIRRSSAIQERVNEHLRDLTSENQLNLLAPQPTTPTTYECRFIYLPSIVV